jgi:flagellar basal-body rod protein FlgC
MKLDKIFSGFNISSRGMSAQRKRLNTISENIANAETTKTEKGVPYQRKQVVMSATKGIMFGTELASASIGLARTDPNHVSAEEMVFGTQTPLPDIGTSVKADPTPFKVVYDPSHPDANEEGYVTMPNVNVVTEMVDMISASRAFEANAVAIGASKTMARDSLEI